MNPIVSVALGYFERHPEAVEQLVDAAVKAFTAYLQSKHTPKAP